MNELFDKLILRFVFTFFLCGVLFLYKYAHAFLYPSAREQLFKKHLPSKNSPDTLHLFSRIIGIGIIFSQFYFNISDGILLALTDFFIEATVITVFYLGSIYIVESIVLYNFEYNDEILKRKNYAYSLICFSHSVGLAYILRTVLAVSKTSMVIVFFLWLFSVVLIGIASKSFSTISKLSFNRLLVQKNISIAASYLGFMWGWCVIISSSLNHELVEIKWYSIQVILKIFLSLIIIPFFKHGLIYIFKIKDDLKENSIENKIEYEGDAEFGYGVYEGSIFFTSCFLTTVITGHINFGNFYPVF